MPVPTPPAVVQFATQTPLMSELIKRAGMEVPLDTPTALAIPETSKPSAKWPMLASALGSASDIISTNWGLRHGGVETNPMLSSDPTKNALAQGAADVGVQLLIHELNKSHPTLAKLLGYGHGAFGAGGTAMTLTHTHPTPPARVFIRDK